MISFDQGKINAISPEKKSQEQFVTIINPIFSDWKSVGLELTISIMYHTGLQVISKALKSETRRYKLENKIGDFF